MQTFLPYPDVHQSAQCLDYKRLGKQRVEALTCFKALVIGNRWKNHPACKMWKGYEQGLAIYYNAIVTEWINRGYKNTMTLLPYLAFSPKDTKHMMPTWFGFNEFHSSHRAALLFKDYEFYKKFGWKETPQLAYYWPII